MHLSKTQNEQQPLRENPNVNYGLRLIKKITKRWQVLTIRVPSTILHAMAKHAVLNKYLSDEQLNDGLLTDYLLAGRHFFYPLQ